MRIRNPLLFSHALSSVRLLYSYRTGTRASLHTQWSLAGRTDRGSEGNWESACWFWIFRWRVMPSRFRVLPLRKERWARIHRCMSDEFWKLIDSYLSMSFSKHTKRYELPKIADILRVFVKKTNNVFLCNFPQRTSYALFRINDPFSAHLLLVVSKFYHDDIWWLVFSPHLYLLFTRVHCQFDVPAIIKWFWNRDLSIKSKIIKN